MSDIPDIQIRPQECVICDNELEPDGDQLHCENCGIHWDWEGLNGELDESEPQCQEFSGGRQCALAYGHDGLHLRSVSGGAWWTWEGEPDD